MNRVLASIFPIWDLCCLVFYRTALAQIHPLHPDVPHIVRRIHAIEHRSAA